MTPRKRRPSDTRPKPQIRVDVADRHGEYVITADLPGVRKQDIDLRARKNRVQIAVDPDGSEAELGSFVRRVRDHGPVSRTIRLPERVNEKRIDAEYLNGQLRITLPKYEQRRSVDVK
ncbi:Hsp20/alpha crystallin family protein [Halorussus lipolyticus]|uniref:Hsp20/alpha crystallin family protein n=1 Tax=Halorussus lipolyticus TaxID=3034024 RepID=UPI0023E8AE55|nr:Hsp20/alpha crystallin family protein [Halorussus sp. DT80]